MEGRRQRKKRETAERIAAAAADLFAERGYEDVAVLDVAEAADVSEQTVYNHFPTKEDLVFDRDAALDDAFAAAIAGRDEGTPAADAVRPVIDGLLAAVSAGSLERSRGGAPRLSAQSPALRRAMLAHTRGHAETIARALAAGDRPRPEDVIAGWALAGVLQLALEELGRAQLAGEEPAATGARLRSAAAAQLTRLRTLG